MLRNGHNAMVVGIAWIMIAGMLLTTHAQECTVNGRVAGMDPSDRPQDALDGGDLNRLFIMASQGGIACYGVITGWSFYKSVACDGLKLQVYRPDDTLAEFRLIGENVYDPANENCTVGEEYMVELDIPYIQQIPVEPGDIIAWIQTTVSTNYTIKYEDVVSGDVRYYDNCDQAVGTVVEAACPPPTIVQRAYSLQASLYQGAAPVISNLPQKVELAEDVAEGSQVIIIYASHLLNHLGISNTINFSVPLTFSLPATLLDFNITTVEPPVPPEPDEHAYQGVITVILPLDYDRQSLYSIPVTVEGMGLQTTQTLIINITRVNEPHAIVNLPNTVNISAALAKAGDEIFQVRLNGSTSNLFPMVYFIEEFDPYNATVHPKPPFIIDSNTGVVSVTMDLQNWWEIETYNIYISVTDGVHMDGPSSLTINILDLRPAPIITNLYANVTVDVNVTEDAAPGSVVFKVEVQSPSDPSTYVFSLIDYSHQFHIDSKTGEIFVSDPNALDYAEATQHTLTVDMRDDIRDLDASSEQNLTIDVIWVNQAPAFIPAEYWIRIPEGCNSVSGCDEPPLDPLDPWDPWEVPGLALGFYDRDANAIIPEEDPDNITCSILPGFAHHFFRFQPDMNGSCSRLEQVENIDVDAHPQYSSINLTLSIADWYGLKNSARVHISVYDINDNAPIFSEPNYTAVIYENTPGGLSLVRAYATDRDSGRNAEIYYELEDIPSPDNPDGTYYFEVDRWTGVVSTKHPVNYESLAGRHKYIEFSIVARDRGEDPHPQNSSARMLVWIRDVNDNAPQFVCSVAPPLRPGLDEPMDARYPCFYNMEVKSSSLRGTYVWQLTATDRDVSTPNPKFYKLIPESDFHLDYDTGNITVDTHSLQKQHKYEIYALATDEGTPELISTPSIVRIDSYSMAAHAVDVTLRVPGARGDCGAFDEDAFLRATRAYITDVYGRTDWFVKKEGVRGACATDRVVIIIYALQDTSTYLYENLEEKKYFVNTRYDLLKPLRMTVLGTPRDNYKDFMADRGFDVILVMPWDRIWLIDTLPGLIVLGLLILTVIALSIAIPLYCCKKHGVCCFKNKPPVYEAPKPKSPPSSQRRRRPSVDTVHSLIVQQPEHLWPTNY